MVKQPARLVQLTTQGKQTVVHVSSSGANWRAVFDALDTAGEALSEAPVRGLEETDAIIAACLRYGSFFNALTCGLPYTWQNSESRVTSDELRCINIEFSAALAQWWRDREQDPAKVNRRVRAALSLLPTAWREDIERDQAYQLWPDRDKHHVSEEERTVLAMLKAMPAQPLDVRKEANLAVAVCWRNGPIEDYHAGMASPATRLPGFCRFTAQQATALMANAANELAMSLRQRNAWDGGSQALLVAYHPFRPSGWSLTDETADIMYADEMSAADVHSHLQKVLTRCPGILEVVSNAPTES